MSLSLSLILPDIRSAYNVGSLFRSADGAGVEHIYLCGHTPRPIDRFGRKRNDIHKTSLGASESVAWSYHAHASDVIESLQKEGVYIVCVEQGEGAVEYTALTIPEKYTKVALVVGNEVNGVPEELRNMCDKVVYIPMHGEKESLNVSVAGAILLYHLRAASS